MEQQMEQQTAQMVEITPSEKVAEQPVFDDKTLLDLAKKRLATKKNMTHQVLDFCLISVFAFGMTFLYEDSDRAAFAGVFLLFWMTRLAVRLVKFAKPSFKDGIAAYFQREKERKLEAEITRLKKMDHELVILELEG